MEREQASKGTYFLEKDRSQTWSGHRNKSKTARGTHSLIIGEVGTGLGTAKKASQQRRTYLLESTEVRTSQDKEKVSQ